MRHAFAPTITIQIQLPDVAYVRQLQFPFLKGHQLETKNCKKVKLDPKTPCALAEQLLSADSQLMARQSAEYFPDTSPVLPSIASNSFLLEKRSKSSMITKQACGSKSVIKPRFETKSATFQLRKNTTAILELWQYKKPFPKFSKATIHSGTSNQHLVAAIWRVIASWGDKGKEQLAGFLQSSQRSGKTQLHFKESNIWDLQSSFCKARNPTPESKEPFLLIRL